MRNRSRAKTTFAVTIGALAATAALAVPAQASTGVIADYHGKSIDLSHGWQGADVCSETQSGEVNCYDLPKGVSAKGTIDDCPFHYTCLWQFAGAEGRRLQWTKPGTKDLSDWDFRDKATGAMNNRQIYGFELIDVRSFQPDRHLFVGVGQYVNLSKQDYPFGGNWDNKVDKVHL